MRRLKPWLRRGAVERELDAELRAHFEQLVRDLVLEGTSEAEARRRARIEFGGMEQVKEEVRESRWVWRWEELWRDVRHAWRALRRSPATTAAAIVTLAIGLGANTAVFSVLHAALMRSLPVESPEELVLLGWRSKEWPERVMDVLRGASESGSGVMRAGGFSDLTFKYLREHGEPSAEVMAFTGLGRTSLSAQGRAEIGLGQLVSGNYYTMLGVKPAAGRLFSTADERSGVPLVVLSHRFWDRFYGRSPSAIGSALKINGAAFTVLGVSERGFEGAELGESPDVSVLIEQQRLLAESQMVTGEPKAWLLTLMARRHDAATAGQLAAAWDPLFRRSFGVEEGPDLPHLEAADAARGVPGLNRLSRLLWTLAAATLLVLLIACANIAGLLLARAVARRREASIKLALGASRARLVREALVENLLLASLGGIAAMAIAWPLTSVITTSLPVGENRFSLDAAPDIRIFAMAAALTLLTGLLSGYAPALRGSMARTSRGRMRRALVAAQVALSLALLAGAGLMSLSLRRLYSVDLGIDATSVAVAGVNGAQAGYRGEKLLPFYERILEEVRATPGTRAAALSVTRPLSGLGWRWSIDAPGFQPRDKDERQVLVHLVSERFLETMGIRLLAGRDIGREDDARRSKVAVVSESAARRFWGRDAVGRFFKFDGHDYEVVGVAANAHYRSVTEKDPPVLYVSLRQHADVLEGVQVLARGPADVLRAGLARVDSTVPLQNPMTLAAQVDETLRQERLLARFSAAFALLALLLAGVGLYGMLAWTAARRSAEMGIRIALGATRGGVAWLLFRDGLVLVVLGAAAGVPLAWWSGQLVQGLLFEVRTSAPLLAASTALLVVAGIAAGLGPALRASRVDPSAALRVE